MCPEVSAACSLVISPHKTDLKSIVFRQVREAECQKRVMLRVGIGHVFIEFDTKLFKMFDGFLLRSQFCNNTSMGVMRYL